MAANSLTEFSALLPSGAFRYSDSRLAYKTIIMVMRNNKVFYLRQDASPSEGEVLYASGDAELIFNFNETFAAPVVPSVQFLEKLFVIYR